MRKIFCHTPGLLDLYYRDFVRDTDKFFRASKITLEHMNVPFDYKGETWKVIGQIDEKEMACKNIENGSIWAIDRITVQRCLIGETNVTFAQTASSKKLTNFR